MQFQLKVKGNQAHILKDSAYNLQECHTKHVWRINMQEYQYNYGLRVGGIEGRNLKNIE